MNKLAELRKQNNMKLKDVVKKMKTNVSVQRISDWEHGRITPGIKNAKKLAKIFGVGLDDIY